MLYGDTATNGSVAATRCGHAWFTTGRCLFASDAPFDTRGGRDLVGGSIEAVNRLEITEAERDQIFYRNACDLLKLD